MPLAASLPSMSAVSSVLQSSSTSPVSVSTMSRASERPTMYSGGTCSVSSFAFSIRRMWRAVMRRPRSTITPPFSSRMSKAAISPRMRSATSSSTQLPLASALNTVVS